MRAATSPIRSQLGPCGPLAGLKRKLAAVVLTVNVDWPLVVVADRAMGFVLNEQVGGSLKFVGATVQVKVTLSALVMFDPVTVITCVPD